MENGKAVLMTGNARSTKVSTIKVDVDPSVVARAAEVATTVIMQKFGDALGASREEVLEVNVVGLSAALMKAADEEANIPKSVWIPAYFDSMIVGMRTRIGRTVITTELANTQVTCPESYSMTVLKMKAAGIAFVRPHRPAFDTSATLTYDRETIDGVECIIGNFSEAVMDDLVRRSLLQLEESELQTLRRLAGELTLQYGELDSLLVDYVMARVRAALS